MIRFNKTRFIRSAAGPRDFPNDGRVQIVFAGRSNVGKSSTINALVGQKNFARTSSKPGKTVFVNLFEVDGRFWLADLPGYGFSRTSLAEKERYSALIEQYLAATLSQTARFYIVVDARYAPTDDDIMMLDYARKCSVPVTVIANKTDKLKKSELEDAVKLVKDTLALSEKELLIPFSAEKGHNRDFLISDIVKAVKA